MSQPQVLTVAGAVHGSARRIGSPPAVASGPDAERAGETLASRGAGQPG